MTAAPVARAAPAAAANRRASISPGLQRGQVDLEVFTCKNATGDGHNVSGYGSDQTSLPNATISLFGPASLFELKHPLGWRWAFEQTTFCTSCSSLSMQRNGSLWSQG